MTRHHDQRLLRLRRAAARPRPPEPATAPTAMEAVAGADFLSAYFDVGGKSATAAQIVARFRGIARESRSLGSPTAAELEEYDQAVEGVVRRVLQEDEGLHG